MRRASGAAACTVAAVVFALAPGSQSAKHAGAKPSAAPDSHDISGFWELSFDSRKVPAADLAPGVTKEMIAEHARADAHAIRWCNLLGTPFIMDSGRPIDIRQGTREIVIASETNAGPRHIYLDRTQHINSDVFDTTSNGDSIAHWDGDSVVADTVGFDPSKGLSLLPGGGFRTVDSHLIERYHLLANGSILSVVFTWEDAKVFKTPHTYEFHYYRLPNGYSPVPAERCDPWDDARAKFLEDAPAQMPASDGR
jgi:hypothetical protein